MPIVSWDNEVYCKAERDTTLGECRGNVFTVYLDRETGEIAIVCHWGHVTRLTMSIKQEETIDG